MFSYVFMKVLEVWPRSYDRQMEKASSGRLSVVKRALAEEIPRGAHVLEIGCGTGDLAVLLVSGRGAMVDGFDLNPAMVAIARERIELEKLSSRLNLWEMGVEGMDGLENQRFEAVVSTLVFSELSADERRFALKNAYRILKPCGRIIIADEVVPRTKGRRILHSLARAPLVATTYLIARKSTKPIPDLRREVADAGFEVDKEERSQGDAFALLVAHRPAQEVAQ